MLVVSQVAMSLVLLISAGLVLRSYAAAQHADAGFDPANVTSVAIDLQTAGYDEPRGQVADHPPPRRAGQPSPHSSARPWR